MSNSYFSFDPEAQQAAAAAEPVRFLFLALVASVSFIALWQIWSYKSAAEYWRGSDAVLAVLLAAYAYETFVLLRKCSRIYYHSNRARKDLCGYLCGRMPIFESVVNVFEFGPLTPWRFAGYIGLLVCSTIALVQPMATFDWMRWLSSCVLVVCTYSITRLWAKAAQAFMFFPYPHGAPLIPKIYLSTLGAIKIPGDWKCYESPKPASQPRCFLSYRGIQEQRAIRLRDALIGAGIEVEMYDPINRWKDAPYEICHRIEKNADCLLYLELNARRSPWVRVEQDWAKSLARPVFLHWNEHVLPITIQRIVRSSLVPRVSFGEHSIITKMDAVFQEHLTSAELVDSKALNRTSGFTMMRRLGYDTQLNDLARAMAEGRFLVIRTVQVFVTLIAFLIWYFAPRPIGRLAVPSLIIVFWVWRAIKYFRKRF